MATVTRIKYGKDVAPTLNLNAYMRQVNNPNTPLIDMGTYYVLKAGFNMNQRPFVLLASHEVRFLPYEYAEWVYALMKYAMEGSNLLPANISFSLENDTYSAKIL